MKLIVEAGATKSDWRLVEKGPRELRRLLTDGMNISTMGSAAVCKVVREGLCALGVDVPEEGYEGVYIYMAGEMDPECRGELEKTVRDVAKVGEIELRDDMVGAARAACQREPGIAAIMGTGSNACFYDGEKLVQKVYSGGFILGDYGSGAVLGKRFVSDYLKGLVPEEIAAEFRAEFGGEYGDIVNNVYRSGSPSKYLGSFAPFIMSHYDNPYVKALADGNFQDFIDTSLKVYDTSRYSVGVVGGFAYANRDIFGAIAAENGIKISRFIPAPIEGLTEYHCI